MMRRGSAVLCAVLTAACATSPTGRSQLRLVSDAQMGSAAVAALQQQTPPTSDARTSRYVDVWPRRSRTVRSYLLKEDFQFF